MSINQKYYDDIKKFWSQYSHEFNVDLPSYEWINRIIVCGMWWSASYIPLYNDMIDYHTWSLEVNRDYTLPSYDKASTLIIISSHSWNTEESLSCYEQAQNDGAQMIVFTSWWKLLENAQNTNIPAMQIPTGLQPRLSTGYFFKALSDVLLHCGLISRVLDDDIRTTMNRLDTLVDEEYTKTLASNIDWTVPIVYTCSNLPAIAEVSKIKFNENAKTQSFFNTFPELNHNEMVGFTDLVMKPFFLIFSSQYSHPRNHQRIEIFADIMREKWCQVEIYQMPWETLTDEIFGTYYMVDHVTYYLAEIKWVDPEPVAMVEDFKKDLG